MAISRLTSKIFMKIIWIASSTCVAIELPVLTFSTNEYSISSDLLEFTYGQGWSTQFALCHAKGNRQDRQYRERHFSHQILDWCCRGKSPVYIDCRTLTEKLHHIPASPPRRCTWRTPDLSATTETSIYSTHAHSTILTIFPIATSEGPRNSTTIINASERNQKISIEIAMTILKRHILS